MTVGLMILCVFLGSPHPLKTAAECYENLDYPCAERAVAEALGGELTSKERVQAWRYEALLAIAWRDLERARRAVRAIYALDADYQPQDVPPNLQDIFDAERPEPPPKPKWAFDSRYVFQFPTDNERDSRWWSMGHGVKLGLSQVRPQGHYLRANIGFVEHAPNDLGLGVTGLQMWGGELGYGGWWSSHGVRLHFGGVVGLRWVSTEVISVYEQLLNTAETDEFFAPSLGFELDVSYPVLDDFSVSFSIAPELLIRNYQEQPHFSYLLPILVGLRYGG